MHSGAAGGGIFNAYMAFPRNDAVVAFVIPSIPSRHLTSHKLRRRCSASLTSVGFRFSWQQILVHGRHRQAHLGGRCGFRRSSEEH